MLYPGLYWLTFVMAIYTRGVIDGFAFFFSLPTVCAPALSVTEAAASLLLWTRKKATFPH